jgi:hypothetical protein
MAQMHSAIGMSGIRLSRDLAADGFGPGELARMVSAGEMIHLRRGAYAVPVTSQPDPRVAHLQLLEATVPLCDPAAVVSHTSAAALHELPVWGEKLTRVHLTRDRPGGGRTRRWVQIHGLLLPDSDIVELEGFRVTGLARTVVDLGCSLPLTQAVAAGDLALTRIERAEIAEVVGRNAGRTGIGKARRAVALLDARSESAGESFSRVIFHLARLPAPELQFSVFAADGRFVARSDFGWPDFGVLGEFDGKQKYGALLRRPGQTAEEVLIAEKRREDRMRELGWLVIRWMWQDLTRPEPLIGRLRQAFAQAHRPA